MKSIYLLGLCCLFGNAHAGLNVIADLGGEPAAPYFDGINNQPNEFESPNPAGGGCIARCTRVTGIGIANIHA